MQILENIVVETFLLNRICYNFSSFIQEYWELIIGDFYQNGLLQFKHINSEQNKTSVSVCVLCNTWHKMDQSKYVHWLSVRSTLAE